MPDDNDNGVPDLFDETPEEFLLKKATTKSQEDLRVDLAAAVDTIRQKASAEHRSILLAIVNALHTGASLLGFIPSDALPQATAEKAAHVTRAVADFLQALDREGVIK